MATVLEGAVCFFVPSLRLVLFSGKTITHHYFAGGYQKLGRRISHYLLLSNNPTPMSTGNYGHPGRFTNACALTMPNAHHNAWFREWEEYWRNATMEGNSTIMNGAYQDTVAYTCVAKFCRRIWDLSENAAEHECR